MVYIPHVNYAAVVAGAIFNQFAHYLVYGSVFSKDWLVAMKKDKNGDHWMKNDKNNTEFTAFFFNEFLLNVVKSWVTGLLLNLTQAQTVSQAAQLGAFMFVGAIVPTVTSEVMWEKRSMDLQRFKYLSGFLSTVFLACVLHSIGTA